MAMPRISRPCTCDECRAAQRMSAMVLAACAVAAMIVAVGASLIFA